MSETLEKMTVSELTAIIKQLIEDSCYALTVEGEISGFKPSPTGHWYFNLKDDNALIGAVVWKTNVAKIGMIPKDGQKVIVSGYVSVYAPGGRYQIVCTGMKVAGEGDILAKLEERKRKYAALGYFDESKKKKIPKRPGKVAVITSPTGAALQDILQVTGRRNSNLDIIIAPAPVQGDDAAPVIAARIKQVNKFHLADVIIVGRGGGSLEDLLPFSSDEVIQAIYESEIPVISAVGHEIDWAISDFAADLRAPTPSAAAELVCESQSEQKEKLISYSSVLSREMNARLKIAGNRLNSVSPEKMKADIVGKLYSFRIKLDCFAADMENSIEGRISAYKSELTVYSEKLKALSPLDILKRGYSIVTDSEGNTVLSAQTVQPGAALNIRFNEGKVRTEVKEIINGGRNDI